jgi:glycosyltransferase involved in cell wall biosynthesis
MLQEAVKSIPNQEQLIIIDDGSKVKPQVGTQVLNFGHRGKQGFWQSWDCALRLCEGSDDDLFVFLQDDCLNTDFDRIYDFYKSQKQNPFFCTLINDGRTQQWVRFHARNYTREFKQIGFVDCIYFCNRAALKKVGFKMFPIPESRFTNPATSSGVGQQMTQRIHQAKIPIYMPIKSITYHGDHESKMHPLERKKHPLISK